MEVDNDVSDVNKDFTEDPLYAVMRDTGLPIVVEDILELATRIRFKSVIGNSSRSARGIIFGGMEGLRPILSEAHGISEPQVAEWVASFMQNPLVVARLSTQLFDRWEYSSDYHYGGNIVTLATPVSLKIEASWKLFGSSHAAIECLRNEYYTTCDPLPVGHGSTTVQSSIAVHNDSPIAATPANVGSATNSLPTLNAAKELPCSSSQIISEKSIRLIGLRAGCAPLSVEAMNVVREKINEFIASILMDSVCAVDRSPTLGVGPGLMLSRSFDDSLDRAGCSVAGLGYKGYVYAFLCAV